MAINLIVDDARGDSTGPAAPRLQVIQLRWRAERAEQVSTFVGPHGLMVVRQARDCGRTSVRIAAKPAVDSALG